MAERKRLTTSGIAALKPRDKPYTIPDIPNLRLHVAVTGRKTWQARRGGTMLTLGNADKISIAEARRMTTTGETPDTVAGSRIGRLAEEYLTGDAAHLAKTSRRRAILYRILKPIIGRELDVLTRPWLIRRTEELAAEGLKPVTQENYRKTACIFVNWCVDKGHLARSPMRKLPRLAIEGRIKFLDYNQIRQFEKACQECEDPRLGCFGMIALHAGLRRNEVLSLEWPQIDLRKGTVTVLAANSKTRKGRTVGMSKTLVSFLKERKPQLAATRPFFFIAVHRPWKRLVTLAELPTWVTPHVLRHTFATLLVRRGIPITVVQKCLGHSSLTMTAIYAHAVEEDVLTAAREFDKPMHVGLD